MDAPVSFSVETGADLEQVLAYFNGFRESFIKSVELRSDDEFEAPGAHKCTGRLELTMVLMHHNFGSRDSVHEITARFSQVTDVRVDVSGLPLEWHVSALEIVEGERVDAYGREQRFLFAEVKSPRRVDDLRPAPSFLFRFQRAVFAAR